MAIRERKSKKSKTGKVYEVYFTYKDYNGITRRYSKSSFLRKKDAKEHEIMKRAEYAKNLDIVRNSKISFNAVFLEYMEVEGANKYAPSTLKYYWFTYHHYIENSIGRVEIFKLRYKELQKYFNDISILGIDTVKNIKKIFNVSYQYALKQAYIPSNPMLMVTLHCDLKHNEQKMEITENEFSMLCKQVLNYNKMSPNKELQEWNNFNYFIAIQLGWYLGLRISETLALSKCDVDLNNNKIYINNRVEYHGKKKDEIYVTSRMKTLGSKKWLPLAEPLKNLLMAWFRENPYNLIVCDIDGHLIHPATISSKIRLAGKEIGIDFHYHMLRHTLASRLARNNINPNVAKELLRHTNITTTLGQYTHINEEDERQAVSKLFESNK